MIYAIRAVGTEFVKIGKAQSVGKRLRDLEVASPHDLHIEAVANWPDEEERRLHIYLRADWIRGEWFKDGSRLEDVIAMMRKEDGLQIWKTACESLLIARRHVPTSRQPQPERKDLSPTERRREERRLWWKQQGARDGR